MKNNFDLNHEYDYAVTKDERGSLVALEVPQDIPFQIKRIYYIFANLQNKPRGFHAHKDLKQIMICISGSCEIHLDNGFNKKVVMLDKPNKAVFVDKMVWREMHNFSNDSVLLVLASEKYDIKDYISNYDEFKKSL
jgi:UDP-2-acetamido-3-amino-2,3-dideoxy-glucuronate N-acetyltransferase